ncbi:MAG: hypothetical protein J6N19_04950 [Clostridium sp.]|nr:hypothetical protein [Clostridium sp.]
MARRSQYDPLEKQIQDLRSASLDPDTADNTLSVQQAVSNAMHWWMRDRPNSDDECADRLNEFFTHILETGEHPSVEKMCLALGIYKSDLAKWESGSRGTVRAEMIKKAMEMLAAIDAELVTKNKMPQVIYIFRAKNFYGMQDQAHVVVEPRLPFEQGDAIEAGKKYVQGMASEDGDGDNLFETLLGEGDVT